MSLFKPAKNESAFLKLGLMGGTGSGKTYTASMVAKGLVLMARERGIAYAKRPVMFIDSENGSDYVADLFEDAGIELLVAKTKAFADLCSAVREAEAAASFLIIDSVSAYWDEWKTTYQRKKGRSRLQFEDFAAIKQGWREGFTDRFINSRLHIAMCGRLAFEYDYSVDDETGKKQLEKTDVKMAAEKELGYETSLFVMMERDNDLKTHKQVRRAIVLKDRFRILDGHEFVNPTFDTFLPHVERLNLGGEHRGIDLDRTSADLVPDDPRRQNTGVRRKIVVDELDALLLEHGAGGTSNEAKTKRAALIKEHFRCTSRTEIEELMPLVDLQANFDSLHRALTGEASRYGVKDAPAPLVDSDEIPFATGPAPAATAADTGVADDGERDANARMTAILNAISIAPNPTQLTMVVKANRRVIDAMDEDRKARLDAAVSDRKSQFAAAKSTRSASVA